jgi:tripartite ATP-independent transporter DctM subunit
MALGLFFGAFVVLLCVGSPIYIAMIVASIVYLLLAPDFPIVILIQKMASSVNSFPLLAVPLFIFSGQLMNNSGITRRIFGFALKLVGHFRGGLAYVNIVDSVIFSGMSGSALADVGGPGAIEIRAMKNAGYDDDITLGLTAASGTIGPIIPPSIPFVIYGAFAGVSIGALFMGGVLPGLLMAICMGVMVFIIAKKRNYPREKRATAKELWVATKDSFLAILTPIILIGGMWTGFFTPTEAAFISIVYAFVISVFVYRDFKVREVPHLIMDMLKMMTPALLILIGATVFGWILTYESVDQLLLTGLTSLTTNKYVILLIINLILLLLGMFIDSTAAILLAVPILQPLALSVGIHPVHLGVVMVLNLMIGLLTPPVGFSLYLLSSISGYKVEQVTKMILPWTIPLFIALILVTLIPEITLFIPRIMGFI